MADAGLLSLLPAAVTILTALLTRRVAWALLAGVAAGSLAATRFVPFEALLHLGRTLLACFTDGERLKIVVFLLLVGGLLHLLSAGGGYQRAAEVLRRWLDRPAKARLATVGLGLAMFFDDYASVLIAGASLRSLRARLGISEAQSAYLVDQTATVVSVVLVSTWAAFEGSLLLGAAEGIGRTDSAVGLLLASLPYHLYTYLGLALALMVALNGRWFGVRLERGAILQAPTGLQPPPERARFLHVILPLGLVVSGSLVGLFGSGLWQLAQKAPGEERSILQLLGEVPTVLVLIGSTLLGLAAALVLLRRDRVLSAREMRRALLQGARGMVPAAMVILLAKGLAGVAEELGTGPFLTGLAGPLLGPEGVPALTFALAFLITVATGFSWSSMAIVMPVAFEMASTRPELLPVVSGAVISGAIAGGMVIPFSDTTVMTAAACGMTPLYHARTQTPQILAAALVAFGGYVLLGLGLSVLLVLPLGLGLLALAHRLLAAASPVPDGLASSALPLTSVRGGSSTQA